MLVPSLFLAACAGTSSVSIPEPTEDIAATEPAPEDDGVPSGSAVAAADAPDAGTEPPDAGTPPAPACPTETEPNDAAGTATPFTTCLVGALASTKDRDYWSVVVPTGATSMQIAHTETGGAIAYRVYATTPFGNLFPTTFTAAAPPITVEGGTTYLVRMTASGAAPAVVRGYQATVTFE